jgi:hypothetical protein
LARAYYIHETRNYRNRNQLLKHLSDTEGGSHYHRELVPVVNMLKRVKGSKLNGVQMFLIDMSALVYWLGKRLLYIWECKKEGALPLPMDKNLRKLDETFDRLACSMM